jgi:HPt (histidine-containing phosphotransfer) domain-containing protein
VVLEEAKERYVVKNGRFKRFVSLFLDKAREKLTKIESALVERDLNPIRENARSLKSAGSLSAPRCSPMSAGSLKPVL